MVSVFSCERIKSATVINLPEHCFVVLFVFFLQANVFFKTLNEEKQVKLSLVVCSEWACEGVQLQTRRYWSVMCA